MHWRRLTRGRTAGRVLRTAVIYGALALASLLLTGHGTSIAEVCPPNAFAIAMMVRARTRRWPAYLAAVGLVDFGAYRLAQEFPSLSALLAACDMLEMAIGACAIRLILPGKFIEAPAGRLALGCALAALAAPLLPSGIAAAALAHVHGGGFGAAWQVWYFSDVLGILTVTPLLLAINPGNLRWIAARANWTEIARVLAAVALTATAVFSTARYPSLFLLYPVLLVVAFRLGIVGTALSIALAAIIGIAVTSLGYGPLLLISGLTPAARILLLQGFFAIATLSMLPVAAVLRDRDLLREAQDAQLAAVRVNQDMLEQREAQLLELSEGLARARDEALAQNRLLELAEQVGRVGHWRYDFDTATLTWSAELYRMSGVDPRHFELTPRTGPATLHPDDRRVFLSAVRDALKTGLDYEMPLRIVRPDGKLCHVICRVLVERDDAGRVVAVFGVTIDMTEQKAVEDALFRAKEAAEEATRAKSEFLSSMSHELRTPLNAVIGFSQLLLDHPKEKLSATQEDYVRYVHRGGTQLLALIEDLLDLSRIETGHLRVQLEDVAVSDVLDEVAVTMDPFARKHAIRLEVADGRAALPPIRADHGRLVQLLNNLVSNGIKYNRPDGAVTVSVAVLADEGRVRFLVSDTGIGIRAERQKELFQPFNRLDAEGRGIEGTGIGLVICRYLATLMEGQLGFASGEGEGSRFWVDLPVAGRLDRAADAPEPTERVRSAA